LTFSDDGNELLVNMGGEQIYLFDINDPNSSKQIFGSSWKSLGNVMSSLLLYMHVNKN